MNDDKNDSMVTRRGFFQRAGLAVVTVSVPAWVWGCGGEPEASEPTSDATSGGETAAQTTVSAEPEGPAVASATPAISDAARAQISAFEAETIYTEAEPGQWEGKAGSHVPQLTFAAGSVELFTQHGMSPEHWIDAHYLKDQDGLVIGFTAYAGTDAEARGRFTLPQGTTQITAYSHCNRHGDWSAEPAAPSA